MPDSAQIQASIYDGYQNISLGLLYFTPFNTVACSNVSTGITNTTPDEQRIEVYPNPSNGKFTIESSFADGQLSVEVYNILGEKVYSQFNIQNSTFKIDLSKQSSGIYFIRLISNTGQLKGEAKVVKQ